MVAILFVVVRQVTVPVINRVPVLLMLIHVRVILKMPAHLIVVVTVVIGAFVVVIFVIVVLIASLILLLVMEQTGLHIVSSMQLALLLIIVK